MKKLLPVDKFINDQLSRWPYACDNFRMLRNVRVKNMEVSGLEVRVQFNPARIRSTSADVAASAVSQRKCFLCRDNRPAEQMSMKFEGRKSKKYDILVNPYPIFPGHLVIASDRHTPQSIWSRYVDMLDMSRALGPYTLFYNGPRCGASAPDHFHFQAAQEGQMPLIEVIDRLMDSRPAMDSSSGDPSVGDMTYMTSVQDAALYHYTGFLPGVFAIGAQTSKSAAKMLYRLLDCAPSPSEGEEPMFNLFTWYRSGEYRSVVMFRDRHRPSAYFEKGEAHLTLSPGCADMAGVVILPVEEDFMKVTPSMLEKAFSEVALSPEAEQKIVWRLTRRQPEVSVGIMSGDRIVFEILSDGAGPRSASYCEGKIEYDGALYDELFFEAQTPSMMFAEPTFVLHDVTIGTGFHWERKENQKFAGSLRIMVEKDRLVAVNIIGVEDYLLSVISSEMKSTSSLEFLKAHAVISRSWIMAQIHRRSECRTASVPDWIDSVPALVSYLDSCMLPSQDKSLEDPAGNVREYVRWYDHEDHRHFDVCADDHCQRYQGLTRAVGNAVRKAVDDTWGEVLMYGGAICDARFSKCCGGVTEEFGTCWADASYPYLTSVADDSEGSPADISDEEKAVSWIYAGQDAFCNTSDHQVLSQVLNSYDMETPDFFRWSQEYAAEEISSLIERKSGYRIGRLLALEPLERGRSGRIMKLRIYGSRMVLTVGKELEIRKILSETHLKSSAFAVEYLDCKGRKVPNDEVMRNAESGTGDALFDRVVLRGAGWGHGVGLCQIGAAVMAERGYTYREILSHYYSGAETLPADLSVEERRR